MEIKKELNKLRKERRERDPQRWDDYDWMTERKNFVEGQINILERILKDGDE